MSGATAASGGQPTSESSWSLAANCRVRVPHGGSTRSLPVVSLNSFSPRHFLIAHLLHIFFFVHFLTALRHVLNP
jgi:hypothetical protein